MKKVSFALDTNDWRKQLRAEGYAQFPGLVQLGHTAAVNNADADRVAVYFRIWLRGLERRSWHCLTNIWDGWKL